MEDTLSSKKLWFSVGAVILTFIYCILAATKIPGLQESLSGFTGLLEFVVGAYLSGNVLNKAVATVAAKSSVSTIKTPISAPVEGSAKASLD